MLFSTTETPYDVRFSVFGIPTRVHPGFWVVAALIGWANAQMAFTLTWVACLFVSILVHELGHALSARSFGWPPNILLYSFGGLAFFSPGHGYTRGRGIWVSFAGPLAGFVLAGLVFVLSIGLDVAASRGQLWAANLTRGGSLGDFAIMQLLWINVVWGLFNLLPILPLDGGRICEELFNARQDIRGRRRLFLIGTMCSAGAAAFLWFQLHALFGAIMFGGMAYQNYKSYEQSKRGW